MGYSDCRNSLFGGALGTGLDGPRPLPRQVTPHANIAAGLIEKAADSKSQVDETSAPPPDRSFRAPDIQS